MVVGGFLILLVPLLVIGTVTYLRTARALEEISQLHTMQVAHGLADTVSLALEKDLRVVSAIAGDPDLLAEATTLDRTATAKKLGDLFRAVSDSYEDLCVYDENGIIRVTAADKSRVGISVADRDYFKTSREGRANIGEMVFSRATGRPIFGIAAPFAITGKAFQGGVLAVVRADFLAKYTSSVTLGQSGYAFMLNRQGFAIAHPKPDFIMSRSFAGEPGLERIVGRMIRQETGTEEYNLYGVDKVAGFSPVPLTGWAVGVSQNKVEVMALATSNRNWLLMVSTIFLVVTVMAVLLLSRTISAPVQKTLATLSQAISQATEAFIVIGLDRKVQFANHAMAAIIDRPIADLLGKPLAIESMTPLDPEAMWREVSEKGVWSSRITGGKSDSTPFTLELTIKPVRERGAISCYLGIGRDVTSELAMQWRLRQSEKMEAIGTLAGGIAHDFNNILSAVFGYADLLLESGDSPEKQKEYATEVLNAAKRAKDLVNRILAFSRSTELGFRPIIPKQVVKEALQLLRASLPATIEIRDRLLTSAAILGDATQIHQVMVNLCSNAGYAMREAGGALDVTLEETDDAHDDAIAKLGLAAGTYLRLKIADTGPGIPPEVVRRIFDPFFTTKPPGEGTGLGLSVVHGIVTGLHGAVSVTSEVGKGACFTVYLPVITGDQPAGEDEPAAPLPHGKEQVMLVDDEFAITQTTKERLERLGYKVSCYRDGISAWEAFAQGPNLHDILVTDYTMPRMTGLELAKKIRSVRPEIPIIICSGYFSLGEKLKEMDRVGFLKKPVMFRDLALTLRSLLDR
jgi:signal transduction histidine kinase